MVAMITRSALNRRSRCRSPTGRCSASDVSAVILNVTVTDMTANSYLEVWPAGLARPTVSTSISILVRRSLTSSRSRWGPGVS